MKVNYPIGNDYCPQTLFMYGTRKEDGSPDFGLFCWISYCMVEGKVGVMAAIGGGKLTRDRINANGIFSANLVTEKTLPLADYFGSHDGYDADKMKLKIDIEQGRKLDVPVLSASPVAFELEVASHIPSDEGEVFFCHIRNVLVDEALADDSVSLEERMRTAAPVRTTCMTYFGWDGHALGQWHEPCECLKKD